MIFGWSMSISRLRIREFDRCNEKAPAEVEGGRIEFQAGDVRREIELVAGSLTAEAVKEMSANVD